MQGPSFRGCRRDRRSGEAAHLSLAGRDAPHPGLEARGCEQSFVLSGKTVRHYGGGMARGRNTEISSREWNILSLDSDEEWRPAITQRRSFAVGGSAVSVAREASPERSAQSRMTVGQ